MFINDEWLGFRVLSFEQNSKLKTRDALGNRILIITESPYSGIEILFLKTQFCVSIKFDLNET
jgi:hypothetical protein